MNLLQKFFETCNYRITEGSEFCWDCYGQKAYTIDSWNGDQDGHSFGVTFDRGNQTVYELQAHDYKNHRSYRWINPEFTDAHLTSAKTHNVDPKIAWEDLRYVDLETVEDFFEKMLAIFESKDYDTRVSVPVDLSDEDLFALMKMAHEKDVTLNQMIEQILREMIENSNLAVA